MLICEIPRGNSVEKYTVINYYDECILNVNAKTISSINYIGGNNPTLVDISFFHVVADLKIINIRPIHGEAWPDFARINAYIIHGCLRVTWYTFTYKIKGLKSKFHRQKVFDHT